MSTPSLIPSQYDILDMNDDCFYQIYHFLSIRDWCSLRETCTRFRTISEYCFDRQSKTFELKDIGDCDDLDSADVKRVLRHFGRFIESLTINEKHFGDDVDCNVLMLFIDRYCPSLIDLSLMHFNLNLATIEKCNRMFKNLKRFVIDDWRSEQTVPYCLKRCTSLKELEFIRMGMDDLDSLASLAVTHIPSLETFKMSRCNVMYEEIEAFIGLNCQLKQVKLFDLDDNYYGILEFIGNELPKVDTLSVHPKCTLDLVPVLNMNSLKKLEVNLSFATENTVNKILRGLSERNNIQELLLAEFVCSAESIGILCTMKALTTLKFAVTEDLKGQTCSTLAIGLKSLHEIHIIECEDTSFDDAQQFCVHLPNLKKIIFNRPCLGSSSFGPSITHETLTSLIEIRKSQAAKETLFIYLNDDDLHEIRNEFRMTETLTNQGNYLKMLALEKEHRSAVYEYGCVFDEDIEEESQSL